MKLKKEIDEIRKWEEKIKREDFKYKTNNYLYHFQQFETLRNFGDSIYAGKIDIHEAETDQNNLLENMVNLNKKSKPKTK